MHTCIVVIVSVSLFGYIVGSADLNEFSDRYSLIEQSLILCDFMILLIIFSLRYCCEIQIILMICKSNFNIRVWMYVHTYVIHYTYLLIS